VSGSGEAGRFGFRAATFASARLCVAEFAALWAQSIGYKASRQPARAAAATTGVLSADLTKNEMIEP
jgi:hypothetical protein